MTEQEIVVHEVSKTGVAGCSVSLVVSTDSNSNHQQLIEVQFKGDRKGFYFNTENLFKKGDFIAVEGEKSRDIGKITIIGDLVATQKEKNTQKHH